MSGGKGSIYQRGDFWLDFARGAGGAPVSPFLYIHWYDPVGGRQRRKSTGTEDVQLAKAALDAQYRASHRPEDGEKQEYTVAQALTDYYSEVGQTRSSAISIKARLLLFTRFMQHEASAGRLPNPFLPKHVDDHLIQRFRDWAVNDPIIARKKGADGEWVREGATRKRAVSTVEESVIQLKAALNHNKKRMPAVPEFEHRTRDEVTAPRNDRLSVGAIGELLDYAFRGGQGRYATPERLLPLRRYLIGAVATIARPDAILDISVLPQRNQWMSEARRLDLNPAGRIQTRKYRPILPVDDVLARWLEETDEWLVCKHQREVDLSTGEVVMRQVGVASVRSAWDTARIHLGLPEGWGPKLLRHSMSTILASRSINPVELKVAMGHAVFGGSTDRYVIFDPDYLLSFQQGVASVFADLARIAPIALLPPER